jgi:sensor domain CHASE-containing protein
MSLRVKTLLITLAALTVLLLIMIPVFALVLTRSYTDLEQSKVGEDMRRVTNALIDRQAALGRVVNDYAVWDDTYQFMAGEYPEYINDNLQPQFLANNDLSLMVYINPDRTIAFARLIDVATVTEIPLTDALAARLITAARANARGILMNDEQAIMIASSPVLPSDGSGSPLGTLLIGRVLDRQWIVALGQSLEESMYLFPVAGTSLPAEFNTVRTGITPDQPVYVRALNNRQVAGYSVINDIDEQPALYARVVIRRDITQQGETTLILTILLLIGLTASASVLSYLLIGRYVLKPMARLSKEVDRISTGGDLSARLTTDEDDHLASLVYDINRMLEGLEQAQKTIRDNNARLRTVIDGAPILLMAADRDQTVTVLEGRELDELMLKPEDGPGRPVNAVFRAFPDIIYGVQQALRGEATAVIVNANEAIFDASFRPIFDSAGLVTGMVGVATDITERMMAEKALGDAYEKLERKSRELRRAQSLLESTLKHLSETVDRGAARDEISQVLRFAESQLARLNSPGEA